MKLASSEKRPAKNPRVKCTHSTAVSNSSVRRSEFSVLVLALSFLVLTGCLPAPKKSTNSPQEASIPTFTLVLESSLVFDADFEIKPATLGGLMKLSQSGLQKVLIADAFASESTSISTSMPLDNQRETELLTNTEAFKQGLSRLSSVLGASIVIGRTSFEQWRANNLISCNLEQTEFGEYSEVFLRGSLSTNESITWDVDPETSVFHCPLDATMISSDEITDDFEASQIGDAPVNTSLNQNSKLIKRTFLFDWLVSGAPPIVIKNADEFDAFVQADDMLKLMGTLQELRQEFPAFNGGISEQYAFAPVSGIEIRAEQQLSTFVVFNSSARTEALPLPAGFMASAKIGIWRTTNPRVRELVSSGKQTVEPNEILIIQRR